MKRTKTFPKKLTGVDFETGKTTSQKATILTNDPSLTGWGWAVLDGNDAIIDTGCIKTESQSKARRIRKGDDRVRRISEINHVLIDVIRKYNVQIILSELPHGSQTASAAVMIGITAGIAQTIADCFGLSIEWYSEGDAKNHLLRKRSATKQEIIDAIVIRYQVPWTGIKYKDEAVADAMAIYHLAQQKSSVINFMRQR
jgi:Holliday junction resolvasome RuvABC endonuclease subunit